MEFIQPGLLRKSNLHVVSDLEATCTWQLMD